MFICVHLWFSSAVLAPGTVEAFRLQSDFCVKFGSPLYAELLSRAADDVERGGPIARVLDGWVGNPVPDALVLRLLGAVHHLVLSGAAPELARYYPSAGGRPEWPPMWSEFLRVIEHHFDTVRAALDRHVQTNETRRSGALLGGFLTVSTATSLPLRVLEIGCSAGLNLCWDRFRYELTPVDAPDGTATHVWGDPASPVTIRTGWEGSRDVFAARATVNERAGCDVAPVDVNDPAQVRVLESFIWADQLERLAQLRGAVALARREPPRLVRKRAAEWLAEQLATPRPGVATVVYHSIMWWYLSEAEREEVTALLNAAGARATDAAPLAWLSLELMGRTEPDLRLTLWPAGGERRLGYADPHGRYVRWR